MSKPYPNFPGEVHEIKEPENFWLNTVFVNDGTQTVKPTLKCICAKDSGNKGFVMEIEIIVNKLDRGYINGEFVVNATLNDVGDKAYELKSDLLWKIHSIYKVLTDKMRNHNNASIRAIGILADAFRPEYEQMKLALNQCISEGYIIESKNSSDEETS